MANRLRGAEGSTYGKCRVPTQLWGGTLAGPRKQ